MTGGGGPCIPVPVQDMNTDELVRASTRIIHALADRLDKCRAEGNCNPAPLPRPRD